jgi:hypothetical protein
MIEDTGDTEEAAAWASNYLTNVKNGYLTNSSVLIPTFLVLAVSSLGTGELRSNFRLARATINRLNKFPTRSEDYITLVLWDWTGAKFTVAAVGVKAVVDLSGHRSWGRSCYRSVRTLQFSRSCCRSVMTPALEGRSWCRSVRILQFSRSCCRSIRTMFSDF